MLSTGVLDADRRARWRAWRHRRPFGGAMFLLISAALLGVPAITTIHLGDVLVTVSTVAGVSTILLSAMMAVCGISVLTNAAARIPAGVAALILALVALPAANFGGFLLGTAAGIVGSALTLAWASSEQQVA